MSCNNDPKGVISGTVFSEMGERKQMDTRLWELESRVYKLEQIINAMIKPSQSTVDEEDSKWPQSPL